MSPLSQSFQVSFPSILDFLSDYPTHADKVWHNKGRFENDLKILSKGLGLEMREKCIEKNV